MNMEGKQLLHRLPIRRTYVDTDTIVRRTPRRPKPKVDPYTREEIVPLRKKYSILRRSPPKKRKTEDAVESAAAGLLMLMDSVKDEHSDTLSSARSSPVLQSEGQSSARSSPMLTPPKSPPVVRRAVSHTSESNDGSQRMNRMIRPSGPGSVVVVKTRPKQVIRATPSSSANLNESCSSTPIPCSGAKAVSSLDAKPVVRTAIPLPVTYYSVNKPRSITIPVSSVASTSVSVKALSATPTTAAGDDSDARPFAVIGKAVTRPTTTGSKSPPWRPESYTVSQIIRMSERVAPRSVLTKVAPKFYTSTSTETFHPKVRVVETSNHDLILTKAGKKSTAARENCGTDRKAEVSTASPVLKHDSDLGEDNHPVRNIFEKMKEISGSKLVGQAISQTDAGESNMTEKQSSVSGEDASDDIQLDIEVTKIKVEGSPIGETEATQNVPTPVLGAREIKPEPMEPDQCSPVVVDNLAKDEARDEMPENDGQEETEEYELAAMEEDTPTMENTETSVETSTSKNHTEGDNRGAIPIESIQTEGLTESPHKSSLYQTTDDVETTVESERHGDVIGGPSATDSAPNPLQCVVCGCVFKDKWTLTSHLKRHTGQHPYQCDYCQHICKTLANLRIHVRTHTGDRPFSCPECPKQFKTKVGLNYHQMSHSGEKPYQCTLCDKAFTRSGILKEHMKIHDGENKCETCDRSFASTQSYREHLLIHSADKPFMCLHCQRTFRHKSNLRKHVNHLHQEKYACGHCEVLFELPGDLESHGCASLYKCHHCDEKLSTYEEYTKHQKNHRALRGEFMCDVCGKRSQLKGTHRLHMRLHSNERPYKCPTCGKAFVASSHLQRHSRIHTGEKPYECPVCQSEKRFGRHDELVSHVKHMHPTVVLTKCDKCGDYFNKNERSPTHPRKLKVHCCNKKKLLKREKN